MATEAEEKAVAEAMRADEPPEFGECAFVFSESPASIQASSDAKRRVTEMVRAQTRPLRWLLDDAVNVEIEWAIHERYRWETDAGADLDNILKPLIDAFTGPEGILVDDSLIKSLAVAWYSTTADQPQMRVRFRFDPDHFLPKERLVFMRVQDALCYPVPAEIREGPGLAIWIAAIKGALATRNALEGLTSSYYPARYVLPAGFIHRSRVTKFPVVEVAALAAEALSRAAGGSGTGA